MNLEGKTALVTGAAMGIGLDTAMAFARRGAHVVAVDRNEAELRTAVDRIEKEGVAGGARVLAVTADVAEEGQVRAMVDAALEEFGRLDIACNNAGIGGGSAPTGEYAVEEWDRVLNVNLRGAFLCMKYEIEAMLKGGGGSIVNISSILGKVAFAQAPAYVASKHGLIGLTKTAAIEYAPQGLRVNAVCPGFIVTPLLEQAGITTDEEVKQNIISLHPIGRMGQPGEVAEAVVWLASEEASFVTGHALLVDGGYTAR